jgi:hypothetical protein
MQFSARQQKDFTKTAEAIKQSPWNMIKAHNWMTDLMAANSNGFAPTWVPPAISWVSLANTWVPLCRQCLELCPLGRLRLL